MKVLLPIKPEDSVRFFSGEKRSEYWKTVFKNPDVTTVVAYESAPTSKVAGVFEVSEILSAAPEKLWKSTRSHAGIDESFFFSYFAERSIALAIKVKNPNLYESAQDLKEEVALSPPQSIAYLP